MSINWWMDKQYVVYSYNEIVFSHKKEQNTDGSYNMHGKHAKRKKPVTKDHVLYDSIYRKWLWSEVRLVVSDSMRSHRRQPTRLPCPWDSPGKNRNGVPLPSPIGSVYTDKSLEAGSRLMVARRWEEWDGGFPANVWGFWSGWWKCSGVSGDGWTTKYVNDNAIKILVLKRCPKFNSLFSSLHSLYFYPSKKLLFKKANTLPKPSQSIVP